MRTALTCLTLGLILGYSLHPSAKDEPLPFAVGDKVRLIYEGSAARDCDVAEMRGQMVRCAQKPSVWMNLAVTLGVEAKR